MGREVRMVPKGWEHPKDYRGDYERLLDGYEKDIERFKRDIEKYGLEDALDHWGGGPIKDDYMLVGVPTEERTHYRMYEDTTEGTPISPAFETAEELAQWLADTNASAFGSIGASYEAWLKTINIGSSMSAAYSPQMGMISGVEANLALGEKTK